MSPKVVNGDSADPLDSTRRNTSAPGQAMEFLVWAQLIQQSGGRLHVFLPLLDRGLDAVVHRLTDGEYIPIQVKSRSETAEGMVEIVVRADSLVDDRALIIAGLLTDEGLGAMLLVIDEKTFKSLAAHSPCAGTEVYSAAFSMHPRDSHWLPYLVPRESLGQRILGSSVTAIPSEVGLQPGDRHDQWLGFLGEAEAVRRLAQNPHLDLFRPFPDLEMVEVLARNNVSGQFAGFQVKAAAPGVYGEAQIHVHKATFVSAATTWLLGLAWLPDESRFAEECLVIPSEALPGVAVDAGDGFVLHFHPKSPERTRLDEFRQPLMDLGTLTERLITLRSAGLNAPKQST